ncbi:SDR family oxidoreductase [Microbacterium sp. cx-55]|uniref:SDR family oxidoreductase n=1 Tax=Microbacterium sp. cx-55 TaxID=2875948 RepID=UPI001CBBF060|nr:SDR family oxidoreductase [Microbacterium sp. cx-55]MBZ4488672.1 SDR family oxidoreductase [Microbacterium sp. cx-55]UGB36085.1 SDR family oxidoreductase [Microbacterium sp. cx-55]
MPSTSSRGVAVVTGGTAGLGRATARELAGRGWNVAVLARGQDGIDGTIADIEKIGQRGYGVSVDVADATAVDAAAEEIERELGPIDLWVNNAMTGTISEFLDTDRADFERATAVTYFGVVNGTRVALRRMVPRQRGQVIQIGSALAHRGIPLQSAYCGAKHAIHGFTDSVVAELTHGKVPVAVSIVDMPALNTVQFGWVKSAFSDHPQPVPPIYQPEVGARAIADVADTPRRRTWVGESTVGLVLGTRFAGRFMDWYLAKNAYEGQLAPDHHEPMMAPNLYEPVPGDHGARGVFSAEARGGSVQTWAIRHRRALSVTGAAAAALGAATGWRVLAARR